MASKRGAKKGVVTDAQGCEVRALQIRLTPDEWAAIEASWLGRNGIESTLESLLRLGLQTASSAQDLINSPNPGQDSVAIIGKALIQTVVARGGLGKIVRMPPKIQKGIKVVGAIVNALNNDGD